MDNKKSGTVWRNGKQVKLNQIYHQNEDDIPEFTRNEHENKEHSGLLNMANKNIKPMVTAVLSALLIGSVLGFLMLSMITNLGSNMGKNGHIPIISDPEDEETTDNAKSPTNSTPTVELPKMDAYVLQGGVFSERVNAEEWSALFQQTGFQTIIWERDKQYFLLTGLAATDEQAKKKAVLVKEHELDVFVKQWETTEMEVKLTEEEQVWILSFIKQWEKSLVSVSRQEGIMSEEWKELVRNYPADSKEFIELVDLITSFQDKDLQKTNDLEQQYFLLRIWQQYESLLN